MPVAPGWRNAAGMFGLAMRSCFLVVLGLAVPAAAQPVSPPDVRPDVLRDGPPASVLIPTATIDNSLEITGEELDAD